MTTDLISAYNNDVHRLLSEYHSVGVVSFGAFRDAWRKLQFSQIHMATFKDQVLHDFYQTLYHIFLSHLFVKQPFSIRVGIMYGLFLLFETQPNSPKIKIFLSLPIWQQLVNLYEEIRTARIADAFKIFHTLKQERAFVFSVSCPSPPGMESSATATASTGSDEARDLTNSVQFEELYSNLLELEAFEKTYTKMASQQPCTHYLVRHPEIMQNQHDLVLGIRCGGSVLATKLRVILEQHRKKEALKQILSQDIEAKPGLSLQRATSATPHSSGFKSSMLEEQTGTSPTNSEQSQIFPPITLFTPNRSHNTDTNTSSSSSL
ncbi:snRNA-activating protein complex subunit 1 [Pelomyxa schiedti]|nr:snRNA-activating protein complex subunit 1 [Pelomyxa schiedti]